MKLQDWPIFDGLPVLGHNSCLVWVDSSFFLEKHPRKSKDFDDFAKSSADKRQWDTKTLKSSPLNTIYFKGNELNGCSMNSRKTESQHSRDYCKKNRMQNEWSRAKKSQIDCHKVATFLGDVTWHFANQMQCLPCFTYMTWVSCLALFYLTSMG